MNLGDLAFKPVDKRANELLRGKLEKAQAVQLRFVGNSVHVICVHEPLYAANTDAYGTARLVCIEEVGG